jgi:hypothetical protein
MTTLDTLTLKAIAIADPVERDREMRRLALLARHVCGHECPACDRQVGIEQGSGGAFYCHGCGHEWDRDEMLADELLGPTP